MLVSGQGPGQVGLECLGMGGRSESKATVYCNNDTGSFTSLVRSVTSSVKLFGTSGLYSILLKICGIDMNGTGGNECGNDLLHAGHNRGDCH